MAQFDVHRNKGMRSKSVPFIVVVQSSQFDRYRRRVVVPLVRRSLLSKNTPTAGSRMNPVFSISGIAVILHPLDTVSVELDHLGEYVDSLVAQGQIICDAMDELLTRSWG